MNLLSQTNIFNFWDFVWGDVSRCKSGKKKINNGAKDIMLSLNG